MGEAKRPDIDWRQTRLPQSQCPFCDKRLDAASSTKGETPTPGCFSVCINCTQLLIFTDDMSLRGVTADEISELNLKHPRFMAEVRKMQMAARTLGRRSGDISLADAEGSGHA